jgi:hypothetical protein
MPILALFRWQADPDALVAAYDREMEDAPPVTLDQPTRTLHVFAPGERGVVVVDLWERGGLPPDDRRPGVPSERRGSRLAERAGGRGLSGARHDPMSACPDWRNEAESYRPGARTTTAAAK